MPQTTDKFYNLNIDLVNSGRIYTETAAVRSIVQKGEMYFFSIYIYRLEKTFIFEQHYIQTIRDLSRDKVYDTPVEFIRDFYALLGEDAVGSHTDETASIRQQKRKNGELLQPLYDDIVLMLFMACSDDDSQKLKIGVIDEYIQYRLNLFDNVSLHYINKYLCSLSISQVEFYDSLSKLAGKSTADVNNLLKTLLKICLADGRMHYNERLYWSEIMQFFRLNKLPWPKDLGI